MSPLELHKARVEAVISVLKSRFGNLSAVELIDLAFQVLLALDAVREES